MRILVADDNPINQKFVYYSLRKHYDLELAGNGREVLEWLNRTDFDLILMDLSMPVMDGVEATTAIRNSTQYRFHDIPIIFITTSDMDADIKRCMGIGANDYLVKPVNSQYLLEKVRYHLNLSMQEQTV